LGQDLGRTAGAIRSSGGRLVALVAAVGLVLTQVGCAKADTSQVTWKMIDPWVGDVPFPTALPTATPTPIALMRLFPPTLAPGAIRPSPTPDPLRDPPALRTSAEIYVVQPGDSLNQIAGRYGVGVSYLMAANGLYNPDYLAVGQILQIPAPVPQPQGPADKLIPDSELVNGPSQVFFDVRSVIRQWDGALAHYTESVEGQDLSGPEIIQLVGDRYSVNPRLLVGLLEYQGGWLTQRHVSSEVATYPMGYQRPGWEGLFSQVSWAANQLNAGFYLWQAGWAGPIGFGDGSVVPAGDGLNGGTIGLQYMFAQLYPVQQWRHVVGPDGFIKVYTTVFGNPFDWAIEPLLPQDLSQPAMQLPFDEGKTWSFTGGPHGGWDSGSAWAALDFAPPGDALGCVQSNAWVTAVTDGLIVRTGNGEVLEDLDQDGNEQTGWVVLYMHVESRDRVQEGQTVHAGQRLGHPSCEGGVADGTHLHLARKYNGVWISADGNIPFNLDGWVSAGTGVQYDGTLTRGDTRLEACACRGPDNQISR
jgi:LasA protease